MTKTKRLLLLGVLLSPVALLPAAFIVARVWLNQHLQRELSFGGFGLRLTNPILGWDLDFRSDSLEIKSPRFSLRSGRIATDLRVWNSIASLRPSLQVVADTIRMRVEPDPADSAERARKRKRRKVPSFPNVRIPVAFGITATRVELARGGKPVVRLDGLSLNSQGPKGLSLEATGIGLPRKGDSQLVHLPGSYRASARWFGKNLRYQLNLKDPQGDFLRLDGERRKWDLRVGRDSLEASLGAFTAYAPLWQSPRIPRPEAAGARPKGFPDFRDMTLRASLEMDKEHRSLSLQAGFLSPAVWQIRPQRVDVTAKLEDSSGRVTIRSQGEDDESAYLQGRFILPDPDSGLARAAERMTATLSGFTRNFRFRIGRRVLPGDAEIRRLRVLPGLMVEADVRTRDSSVLHARAFRAADSGAAFAATAAKVKAPFAPGSAVAKAWNCVFTGTIDPGETWVHAWVDTNVSFRHARVAGEAGKRGLKVETWIRQPKAYGSAADSLYALQTVNGSGYHLTASRVHGKEAVWPVTGQVVWGKRKPGEVRRKRNVALAFRTKHPRYGSAEYSMPGPGRMVVKVENLDGQKLPYVRLPKLLALRPVATGGFAWNIRERSGWVDASSRLAYKGRNLAVAIKADWDARRFTAKGLEMAFAESRLRLSGEARLSGRQFFQLGKLGLKDIRGLALEAERFDAAGLADFLGKGYPVEKGVLNGKLAYTDTTGFQGAYQMRDLELLPAKKFLSIPLLAIKGEGENLRLSMRTVSQTQPMLNDSVTLRVGDILGRSPEIAFRAVSKDGMILTFQGLSREFKDLEGVFSLRGRVLLPGQAGEIKDARLGGRVFVPFTGDLRKGLILDSGSFAGRYAVPGLDMQNVSGTISVRNGRLAVPDLRAANGSGIGMTGEAVCDLSGSPKVTARLRGANLALQWPGIQKLVLKGADASLRIDSTGLWAKATVGNAEFASSKPPVSMRGSLEGLDLEYARPPAAKPSKGGSPSALGSAAIPRLKVAARLRDFTFRHKIGFRELQRSIRTVKVDKRKKRVRPMEVQLNIETAGSGNRVDTDILRMVFAGDIDVRGVYPNTLVTGEFSALSGELGQKSQSYDITDFDLKWQNATVEEGRISVEGGKKLRSDCKPDTKRTCNVYVKLAGRLEEMTFTYDTDCGGNTGATLEPSALINSVSRGCYSDEYVAGSGGGNYGEAVFALLEPTINEKLSSVGSSFSGGWIKRTAVTGIGTAVSGDTAGSEPIAIGVESKEKWGVSLKAKAGYHPEKKLPNPWENKVALEWRPPLEKVSKSSEWKRRVRDRVTLEASAETRPEEKINEENRQVRKQVGVRYRYKFWNLW